METLVWKLYRFKWLEFVEDGGLCINLSIIVLSPKIPKITWMWLVETDSSGPAKLFSLLTLPARAVYREKGRRFLDWCLQIYRYNLDAYSLNQPIRKQERNNPAILLVRQCTYIVKKVQFLFDFVRMTIQLEIINNIS